MQLSEGSSSSAVSGKGGGARSKVTQLMSSSRVFYCTRMGHCNPLRGKERSLNTSDIFCDAAGASLLARTDTSSPCADSNVKFLGEMHENVPHLPALPLYQQKLKLIPHMFTSYVAPA